MRIQRRTLIIGLGGTGCFALRFAKQRLREYGAIGPGSGDSPVRFLPIDLDEESRTAEGGDPIDEEFIQPQGALVSQKIQYIDRPENSVYWSWYADKDRAVIKLRQAHVGAGQWRPLGRLAYCENQNLIEAAILAAVSELASLRFKGEQGIDVILVASLAGGTGSGTLLDVSYYLQSKDIAAKGYLPTAAFLLLPRVFQTSDTGHRTEANTYAALKELACFYRQQKDFTMHYPLRGEPFKAPAGTVVPYSNIFLFDSRLPNRTLAEPRQCFEYMGNMIFLRAVTKVTAKSRSNFSNESYPPRQKGSTAATLRESGFVFSSCSGALFILPTREEVIEELFKATRHEVGEGLRVSMEDDAEDVPLQDWRQRLRMEVIFAPDLLDKMRIALGIANKVGAYIVKARQAIQAQSIPALKAACLPIINFDWDGEIAQAIDSELATLKAALRDRIAMARNPLESQSQRLSTFAHHTRIARALLEEKLKSFGPTIGGEAVNPLIEEVHRLKEVLDGWSGIRKFGWFRNKMGEEFASSPVGPWRDQEFLARGLAETKRVLEGVEAAIKSTNPPGLGEYIQSHCYESLHQSLNRLVDNLKSDEAVLALWFEALDGQAGPTVSQLNQEEKQPTQGSLNIASISAAQIVEDIQIGESGIFSEFDEVAMQAVGKTRTREGLLVAPSNLGEKAAELVKYLKKIISERLSRQGILLSQEAFDRRLDEILDDAKILLFENFVSNASQESAVLYFRPKRAEFLWKDETDRARTDSRVAMKIRQTFQGAAITLGESAGPYLAIYHETHHHPAENISSIVQLHEAYQAVAFPTACLHIHKEYALLDNLLGTSAAQSVLCGNSGCEFNLADVPRDVLFCPGCEKAVLNRCGNPSCNVDNLLEKIGGLQGISPIKIMCPACNHRISTFWWHCEVHGPQWREKKERFCLKCNEAVVEENLHFSEKSVRDGGRAWEVFCVRCRKEQEPSAVFSIPLPELYLDVPKHKVPLLLSTLRERRLEENLCPTCGARLFPECPHGNGDRHFAIRGPGGRLVCNNYDAHGESMVFLLQCYNCEFPLVGEEATCPRCNRELLKCPNCTETKGYLIPREKLSHEQRCPVCSYEVIAAQA